MPTSSRVSADSHPSGSASSIVVDAERRYHLLKITDYSLTKLATNGEQINSSTFRVGGRTWRVRYYPNGCQSKNTDYISLFLTLDDTAANTKAVKAQVHFSLLDQRGKPVPFYTGVAAPESLHLANSWGCDKFIKREALEKSEHLSNDCFTVKVDVVVVRGFHAQEMPSIVVPPSNMSWHFGDLLSSKAGADVKFVVGGETFSAHRWVLAARSPVFRAQFSGPMKESTDTSAIQIDDMEAQAFRALLTFMYTDALPDSMDEQEEYAMAQHLLVAADRYDLDRLKLISEDMLTSRINASSVATIWALAEQHQCHDLKAACLAFLLRSSTNLNEVLESEDFKNLIESYPHVVKDLLTSKV
jgi:speckle-type POZ protein